MPDIQSLSRFFTTGKQVSGNSHFITAAPDEIALWGLPRQYLTQVDYTGTTFAATASGATTFPKFYSDDVVTSLTAQTAFLGTAMSATTFGYTQDSYRPFQRTEYAKGPVLSLVKITLNAYPLNFANTSANLWATTPLLVFPFARALILGGTYDVALDWTYTTFLQTSGTAANAGTAAGTIGFGSAPATNTTQTSTIIDMMAGSPSTTALETVATSISRVRGSFIKDGEFDFTTKTLSTTAKNLNMSFAITTGGSASSAQIVPVTGTITLCIGNLGNY